MSERKSHFRKKLAPQHSRQRRPSSGSYGPYQVVADDPTLARFLKYSQNHYTFFKQHMSVISDAEIVEDNNKKIVYECSRSGHQGLDLNRKNFQKICDDRIRDFLQNYKTRKQDFDHDSLLREVAKDPDYFAEQTRQDDFHLFVRWRINQNSVFVSGPKELVDAKLKELNLRVYGTRSGRSARKSSSDESTHHVFKLPAPDPSVARFIYGSNREQQKFQEFMKDFSTASVTKQDNGTIVLECRLLKDTQLSFVEFSRICKGKVLDFLSRYVTKKKCFERMFLLDAYRKHPSFFEQQSKAIDRDLYLRWHRDTNMVIITGLKDDVERSLEAVLRFLNPPVNSIFDPKETPDSQPSTDIHSPNRNKAMFVRISQDNVVAKFIKQSRVHMKRMYTCFNPFAFVTIVENNNSMEYHFSPYMGLQVDKNEFRLKVSRMFDDFLSDFITKVRYFDKSAIQNIMKNDAGFFDRQTKENTDYIFLSWRLHRNEVAITGHKNDVSIKTDELNAIFKGPPSSSSVTANHGNKTKENFGFEYYPTAPYKESLLQVLRASNMRNMFVQNCKQLCTISNSYKIPVQVSPVDPSNHMNRKQFMDQCRATFESFLEKFVLLTVMIDPGIISLLKGKLKPEWTKDLKENKNIVMKWLNDGVSLFGETTAVLQCRKKIEENLKSTTVELEVDKSICRILDKCEVLKRLNAKFGEAVNVTCPPDKPVTIFQGMPDFIKLAKNDLASMDLVEEKPTISEEKSAYLRKMLSDEIKNNRDHKIHSLLDNCGIKATIVLRDRELLVIAATKQDFERCCNRLNNIVQVQSIGVPNGVPMLALINSSEYKKLESKYYILCKGKQVDIMTIEANKADKAQQSMEQLFQKFVDISPKKDHNQNLDKKMEDLSMSKNKNAPVPKKRNKVSLGIAFPGSQGVSGITHNSSLKNYGNLNVDVKLGNIVNETCDMIFNGVNNSFNLSKGTVSAAILKAAGPQIDQQCKNSPLLSSPIMKVTGGFNLKCNYVLHLVTPLKASDLEDKLVVALKCATEYDVKSVAIPTLGAGAVGLDADNVAALMSRAFKRFSQDKPEYVMNISVIVFELTIFSLFKKEIVGAGSLP